MHSSFLFSGPEQSKMKWVRDSNNWEESLGHSLDHSFSYFNVHMCRLEILLKCGSDLVGGKGVKFGDWTSVFLTTSSRVMPPRLDWDCILSKWLDHPFRASCLHAFQKSLWPSVMQSHTPAAGNAFQGSWSPFSCRWNLELPFYCEQSPGKRWGTPLRDSQII